MNVAIDDTLQAAFISREDLLAAKLAAGRPQDLADVEALTASQHERSHEQRSITRDPTGAKGLPEAQEGAGVDDESGT